MSWSESIRNKSLTLTDHRKVGVIEISGLSSAAHFTRCFFTIYALELCMVAFLVSVEFKIVTAVIKLTCSLLSQLISMAVASCLRTFGLN